MVRKYYICPRCDSRTVNRSDMSKHFKRNNACANTNNIELTDEIKAVVLEDHIYHPPSEPQKVEVAVPEVKNVMDRAAVNRKRVNMRPRRGRSRSRARVRFADRYPGAIGLIYIYLIIPRFQTHEEALAHLNKRGYILKPNDSIIICKDDLDGQVLVKVGKTEFSAENRQIEYMRVLQELYIEDEEHLIEFPINFITRLSEVEDQAKSALSCKEAVGLVRDNVKVFYPREVFLADSLDSAKQKVESAIEQERVKAQTGIPINVDKTGDEVETLRLEQMKEVTRQLELKAKMLETMVQMGASKDDILKVMAM